MKEKIVKYLRKHSEYDLDELKKHLIEIGYHEDEIDEAIEEYNSLQEIENDIVPFPDPFDEDDKTKLI
jgi:uncharacterized protein Smg (DUF494 family)